MQDTLSFGAKLFFRAVVASILCAIVYMSMAFVFTAIGTEKIGYQLYHTDASGTVISDGTYYFKDLETYEQEANQTSVDEETGETITYYTQSIRSELSTGLKILCYILDEFFMLGMYLSMLYVTAWEKGKKDLTAVQYDKVAEDKNKGLKAGFIATIPALLAFILLLLGRFGVSIFGNFAGTFKIFSLPFFPLVAALMPTSNALDMHLWAAPILLVFLAIKPLFCWWAYRMGYADILLKNKLLFKGKKKKKSH